MIESPHPAGWGGRQPANPPSASSRDKWSSASTASTRARASTAPDSSARTPRRRAALIAARAGKAEDRSTERRTVSWLVRRYVASQTRNHAEGPGGLRVGDPANRGRTRGDPSCPSRPRGRRRMDRSARRRRQAIPPECADMPHRPTRPGHRRRRRGFDPAQPGRPGRAAPVRSQAGQGPRRSKRGTPPRWARFLEVTRSHRWAIGFRLGVLYGLRRTRSSPSTGTTSTPTRRRCGLTRVSSPSTRPQPGDNTKNDRSRRRIPMDDETLRVLAHRRAEQATERLLAGPAWVDRDLVVRDTARTPSAPRSYDRALHAPRPQGRASQAHFARPPPHRRDPHGRRRDPNRPATAIADILGHSPDMLMKTYAHALPASTSAVVDAKADPGAMKSRRRLAGRRFALKPRPASVEGTPRAVRQVPSGVA